MVKEENFAGAFSLGYLIALEAASCEFAERIFAAGTVGKEVVLGDHAVTVTVVDDTADEALVTSGLRYLWQRRFRECQLDEDRVNVVLLEQARDFKHSLDLQLTLEVA